MGEGVPLRPAQLVGREEPLCEELEHHVANDPSLGRCIQHPLVYSVPHPPELNAYMNAMLRQKQEAVNQARLSNCWADIISLHERPWRLQAFWDVSYLLSENDYWAILGEIWIDSENIHQNRQTWEQLIFNANRSLGREGMMNEGERKALAALRQRSPGEIEVFRGSDRPAAQTGISWTLNLDTAIWFATRWSSAGGRGVPKVLKTSVEHCDIAALFTRRGEDEVLIRPPDPDTCQALAIE